MILDKDTLDVTRLPAVKLDTLIFVERRVPILPFVDIALVDAMLPDDMDVVAIKLEQVILVDDTFVVTIEFDVTFVMFIFSLVIFVELTFVTIKDPDVMFTKEALPDDTEDVFTVPALIVFAYIDDDIVRDPEEILDAKILLLVIVSITPVLAAKLPDETLDATADPIELFVAFILFATTLPEVIADDVTLESVEFVDDTFVDNKELTVAFV